MAVRAISPRRYGLDSVPDGLDDEPEGPKPYEPPKAENEITSQNAQIQSPQQQPQTFAQMQEAGYARPPMPAAPPQLMAPGGQASYNSAPSVPTGPAGSPGLPQTGTMPAVGRAVTPEAAAQGVERYGRRWAAGSEPPEGLDEKGLAQWQGYNPNNIGYDQGGWDAQREAAPSDNRWNELQQIIQTQGNLPP